MGMVELLLFLKDACWWWIVKSLNDIGSLPMGNQGTVVVLDLYGC